MIYFSIESILSVYSKEWLIVNLKNMAKTKDGVLYLNKTERKAIHTIIQHTIQDLSYMGEGTYNVGDVNNTPDKVDIKLAGLGIGVLNFILQITE